MKYSKYLLIIVLAISILPLIRFFSGPSTDGPEKHKAVELGQKPHVSDGRGVATVRPADPVTVLDRGTWTISYIADSTGIVLGGGIVFQVSPFWGWSSPQVADPDQPGYTSVRSSNPEVRFELQGSDMDYIIARLSAGELSAGDTVQITFGDTGDGEHPGGKANVDKYAERGEEFFIKVDGNGDSFFVPIKAQPTIDILAGPASKLVVEAPSLVETDKPFEVSVTALDPLDNWDRSFTADISIEAEEGLSMPGDIQIASMDSGLAVFHATATKTGRFNIRVIASRGSMESVSDPIVCLPERPEYHLYWGDLQAHSRISDGSGSPDELYQYARYVSGMDVSAVTDHDAHGLLPLDENPALWHEIVESANSHYEPGKFVTFVAYEWTSWTYGHRHVLFPKDDGKVFSFRDPKSDTPAELGALLAQWGAIAIPHHPAGGPVAVDWEHHEDRYEPLVEICSVHGNSDSPGAPLQIYHPVDGAFVTDALQRGFRLGILASGDTHDGHPGRKSAGAPSMGIAGIWASDLSREGIWDALLAKRVYGTSGERIILRFLVDGHWMGEIASLEKRKEADFEIRVEGSSNIQTVEVLERERIIQAFHPDSDDASIDFQMPVDPPTWFRVRVYQEDEGMAWSSPVWFDEKR